MTVRLMFSGTPASISGGRWSSVHGELKQMLQTLEDTRERPDYDPDPDLTGAQYAIEALKDGRIVSQDPPTAESATRAVW